MANGKTEVLFPPWLIPELREMRGEAWRDLVDQVSELPPEDPQRLAFILMMVRLGSCTSCHADSYWAMQGCARCSRNTITRFRGSDNDLQAKFDSAQHEIQEYLKKLPPR
jgi:hypothetical protein